MKLLVALLTLLLACSPAASPDSPPIALVHKRQCGRCHVPPQPGTRSRATLQDAFTRHKDRVHMSDEDWASMVDYLAAPAQ